MPITHTLVFKSTIHASAVELFRAFTNPTALRDWFCSEARVDLRTRQMHLWWNSGFFVAGEYKTLEPGRRVIFTWQGKTDPAPTRVTVQFVEKGDATQVTVKHSGIGNGNKWTKTAHEIEEGWSSALENLKSVWEDGIDLRIARVPRLGVFVGEFNAQIAKQLGVPTTQGIRLDGTADGSGARAAGLAKDDVIVKLAGKKINHVPSLFRALQGHQAGDCVAVIFYRGKEKQTRSMELSARVMPPLPASGKELADRARANYIQLNGELAQRVSGLTEPQADFRSAPNEWSIKELIAHFIACERDVQSWLAELLNGGKESNGQTDDSLEFRPNTNLRLATLVTRYPTVSALLKELQASEDETLAMLENLPAEFLARKHLYRRVADWMTQIVPSHFRQEHFPDLDHAITKVRR